MNSLKVCILLSTITVPKTYFPQREFSFTLKDDVYLRYQSFSDQQELEKEIQKRCPYKIDIGAIFSHRVSDNQSQFRTTVEFLFRGHHDERPAPLERSLVDVNENLNLLISIPEKRPPLLKCLISKRGGLTKGVPLYMTP